LYPYTIKTLIIYLRDNNNFNPIGYAKIKFTTYF